MDYGQRLCRDCLADHPGGNDPRCASCGSPRLLAHPERDGLAIAHIDCDAFYAAVEKRDNPALADQPVIIGGGKRGVVSTACYIARTYGVRSAMPMFQALAACPQAVVIRPNMNKYVGVGRMIRQMMLNLTPLVEPLSIDEAFLDLSGTQRLHGTSPAVTLARLARRVETDIGVSVSIGLSYCKFLAKVASDLDKPRGFAIIGRTEALDFLKTKPVSLIWGVGKAMQEHLRRGGIERIGDLQQMPQEILLARYGSEGQRFYRLSRGIDDRRVSPERLAQSISSETTFGSDIADLETLTRMLFELSEKVAKRMKHQNVAGSTVTLKLKSADFTLRTRARALPAPTQLSRRIFEAGRVLLVKEAVGTKFRLIGIGMSHLCDAAEGDRGDLADHSVLRERAAETAIDKLRDKFGDAAIVRGILFDGKKPL
jgi:DNA polymerase-4